MIASVQPSMDASSNSSARRRVAGGLRLRLRVGIGHEHTHTHWKTNPYDSNPFLFSAKRRDQGGHKEVRTPVVPISAWLFRQTPMPSLLRLSQLPFHQSDRGGQVLYDGPDIPEQVHRGA